MKEFECSSNEILIFLYQNLYATYGIFFFLQHYDFVSLKRAAIAKATSKKNGL